MQKRSVAELCLVFLALAAILVLLKAPASQASSASTWQAQMPGTDAQQLWNYITKVNSYKNWRTLPNLPRYVQVREDPHGDWVAVYLNNEAYDSITYRSKPFQMKYGSIVVKENYALAKGDPSPQPPLTSVPVELVSLTVMYKVKGYQTAPGEEEWFWVMYGCRNGYCDGSVAKIGDQPWLKDQIPLSKDTFAFYKGAVMAGKPWLCIECHQRAQQEADYAFGDYMWKVKFFAPQ